MSQFPPFPKHIIFLMFIEGGFPIPIFHHLSFIWEISWFDKMSAYQTAASI